MNHYGTNRCFVSALLIPDTYSFPSPHVMKPTRPEWHNEDQIEATLRGWLEGHGWRVQDRTRKTGEDISAEDPNGTPWLFEVKGYPATFYKKDGTTKPRSTVRTQRRTWFVEALGQIVSRMKHPGRQYGLVFPDNPADQYFEEHALQIPGVVRTKLNLWVFLVNEKAKVKALSPHNDCFNEWNHYAHTLSSIPGDRTAP